MKTLKDLKNEWLDGANYKQEEDQTACFSEEMLKEWARNEVKELEENAIKPQDNDTYSAGIQTVPEKFRIKVGDNKGWVNESAYFRFKNIKLSIKLLKEMFNLEEKE